MVLRLLSEFGKALDDFKSLKDIYLTWSISKQ
jgi:hypothetical protein